MECEGDLVRAYDFGTSQLVNKLNLGPGVSMGFTMGRDDTLKPGSMGSAMTYYDYDCYHLGVSANGVYSYRWPVNRDTDE